MLPAVGVLSCMLCLFLWDTGYLNFVTSVVFLVSTRSLVTLYNGWYDAIFRGIPEVHELFP